MANPDYPLFLDLQDVPISNGASLRLGRATTIVPCGWFLHLRVPASPAMKIDVIDYVAFNDVAALQARLANRRSRVSFSNGSNGRWRM